MTTIKRRPDGSPDESQAMVCSCCGIVLSMSGSVNARALCDYCYWKGRFEEQTPLQDLIAERSRIKSRLRPLVAEEQELEARLKAHRAKMLAETPWWKKLLADFFGPDQDAERMQKELWALSGEVSNLSRRLAALKSEMVLCRSCNSAKGEIAHTRFFDATTVERVRRHQETVLSTLLDDERFMGVFRKWYRK